MNTINLNDPNIIITANNSREHIFTLYTIYNNVSIRQGMNNNILNIPNIIGVSFIVPPMPVYSLSGHAYGLINNINLNDCVIQDGVLLLTCIDNIVVGSIEIKMVANDNNIYTVNNVSIGDVFAFAEEIITPVLQYAQNNNEYTPCMLRCRYKNSIFIWLQSAIDNNNDLFIPITKNEMGLAYGVQYGLNDFIHANSKKIKTTA